MGGASGAPSCSGGVPAAGALDDGDVAATKTVSENRPHQASAESPIHSSLTKEIFLKGRKIVLLHRGS